MSLNMLMWLAMLIAFAGILFLAAAAYMALAAILTTALAALFVGLALIIVCVVLATVIWLAVPRTPAGIAEDKGRPHDDNASKNDLIAPIERCAADWTRKNAEAAMAGALITGIVLSASPGLRRFVFRTAGPIMVRKVVRLVWDSTSRRS